MKHDEKALESMTNIENPIYCPSAANILRACTLSCGKTPTAEAALMARISSLIPLSSSTPSELSSATISIADLSTTVTRSCGYAHRLPRCNPKTVPCVQNCAPNTVHHYAKCTIYKVCMFCMYNLTICTECAKLYRMYNASTLFNSDCAL